MVSISCSHLTPIMGHPMTMFIRLANHLQVHGRIGKHSLMSAADYHTTLRIQTTNGERDFLDTAVTTGNLTCVIPVLQVRNMTVTINDVSRVVPVLPSDNVYEPLTVALHADLRKGSNTITISGFDGEDAPDIDSIMVTAPLQGKNNYQISGP
ncbi:hypothetical protein FRC08_008461 [Ceratobasidium sp. 394]|nr:hypothetical protein FRC08_008461 [Ceratobasidium sp. 394]